MLLALRIWVRETRDGFVFNFCNNTSVKHFCFMNEITQGKVGVFWESALWEGLDLFY